MEKLLNNLFKQNKLYYFFVIKFEGSTSVVYRPAIYRNYDKWKD